MRFDIKCFTSKKTTFRLVVKPFICLITFCTVSVILLQSLLGQTRKIVNFDADWRFYKGDTITATSSSFNDGQWRTLNLPHDWSIEGNYSQSNTTGRGGGYLPAGIGWYRKTFSLDQTEFLKRHFIEFDGIMAYSDVWINGVHLGKRPYGYISFSYDITKHLVYGVNKKNIIVVRVDNSIQPASRYYTGAGIYRHVRLVSVSPTHFTQWGTSIVASNVTTQNAIVTVQTEVFNESSKSEKYVLQTSLANSDGNIVKTVQEEQLIPVGDKINFKQVINLNNPQLWNTDQPTLYKVLSKLSLGKKIVDEQAVSFGIRDARFEAATGFWLNGKNIKIKGVCLHHDAGAVGAAVPLSIWEDRFRLLKQVGVNAIRTSHNPVAPEFLDLCDRMGFLVMNETFDTWTAIKNNGEKGYNLIFKDWWKQDTKDMVLRDRNHPSVIIYSIGNEIHDDLSYPKGFSVYKAQQDVVKMYDSTRPVTMALFRPANSQVYLNGFASHMDVVGQNYRENELIAAHEMNPSWKVIGTENTHVLSQWLALRDKPYMAGQFLWTGFDYLGEADWPETTNNQGLFDRANNWKQQALQRESWWSEKPVVHIVRKSENAGAGIWVADWTPTDFDTYDNAKLQVYSNCEEVELFLNGKSVGSKKKLVDDSPREWDLTFEEGSIKAIGKNNGKEVAVEEFQTAGSPARIILTSTKNSLTSAWDDAAIVRVMITDEKGVLCPNISKKIHFNISGSAFIQAVDNGDIISHQLYKASDCYTYKGKCIAVVKAEDKAIKANKAGEVNITAEAEGLPSATLVLNVSEK